MNHIAKHLCLLSLAACLTACEDEGLDVLDIDVPEGYALSAGISTIFLDSPVAYDTQADWIDSEPAMAMRFRDGDGLYDDARTTGEGLGPVYAGYSCGSCHRNAGRTKPELWNAGGIHGEGGSGSYGFSSMLVYVSRKNGAFFQGYGRVLHDQAIYGVQPEGKLNVKWHYEQGAFPDGEPYELCYPEYTITEWYADSIAPEDLFCTVRIPLRHVGMGPMMAIDRHEIEQLAAKSNYPEYGISGRANYITEKGKLQLGLRMQEGSMMGLSYDQLDISAEDMEDVDLYMQGLGVPARRNVNDPTVQRGEQMFYQAKCHLCHVTTLHTQPRGSTLLMGTQLTWLGSQTIHPYSDFLLHDMGSEIMGVGLNDNYVSGLARGNEWRTTPLWGIGLQQKVNGHTYFLHDGRARNFIEAILWHGGEGEASKNLFKHMPKEDRDALVRFLESL